MTSNPRSISLFRAGHCRACAAKSVSETICSNRLRTSAHDRVLNPFQLSEGCRSRGFALSQYISHVPAWARNWNWPPKQAYMSDSACRTAFGNARRGHPYSLPLIDASRTISDGRVNLGSMPAPKYPTDRRIVVIGVSPGIRTELENQRHA